MKILYLYSELMGYQIPVFKAYVSKYNAEVHVMLLGSDSTFSGWGAFFGQKPSIFNNKHYGRIMIDEKNEIILKVNDELPEFLIEYINSISMKNGF